MKKFTWFTRKNSIYFSTAWNAKIVFLLSLVLSIYNPGIAQVLYGTTSHGGEGGGTITKYDVASNTLTDVFVYDVPGRMQNELVEASNGKLFGTTLLGGSNDGGIIYSLDAVTYKYTKVKNLDSGTHPRSALVEGADKKLYGVTANSGTIFSFDPTSSTYTTLKTFSNTDGPPLGKLVQLADGRLYGVAAGPYGISEGVIFSFHPVTLVYTVIKYFDDQLGGKWPTGNLLKGADGKLYGMTVSGGVSDRGVLFSLDPITLKYTKLLDVDSRSRTPSNASLMQASDGKLYGTLVMGLAETTIFSYDLKASKYTDLIHFQYSDCCFEPVGSLLQTDDGKLYGLSNNVSGSHGGLLFSFDPTNGVFAKIRNLNDSSGSSPSGMIKTSNGKLVGILHLGGGDISNVFTFDPGPGTYTSFDPFSNLNGLHPFGALLVASDGKLYGMTTEGGKKNQGVIFSFDPISTTYTKLKDFNGGADGSHPNGLVEAPDKMLYGTTTAGGTAGNHRGVLFSLDPVSLTYTKLKDFSFKEGYVPNGGLTHARGKLFGTTSYGGTFNDGVIFSFDPATGRYNRLKNLNYETAGAEGSIIHGLTYARDRDFYGMSSPGYPGVLFSLDPPTSKFTVLVNGITKGVDFSGKLIQAFDSKLYGLAQGGTLNAGVIFSYDPATHTYKKLRNFHIHDGDHPIGSLLLASDGKLYGSTSKGGRNNEGVLFSYDIKDSTFKKLLNLQSQYGVNTLSTLVEYPVNPQISLRTMLAPETQKAGTSLLTVKASPNPSTTNFLVEIQGSLKDGPVEIVVTDISGRKIYQKSGALSGQYRFGDLFTPGVYFVKVTQGQTVQTLKIIKAGSNIK